MLSARALYTIINNNFTRQQQGCSSEDPNNSWPLYTPGCSNLWVIGWCNKVSSFLPVGLGGFDIIYDKPWYKRKMATFTAWGFGTIQFCGPYSILNNKACSWINGGI